MKKHLTKWYFKNEDKVMEKLGFKPQPGSGNGWLNKEDGENEFFLAQLKSTESNSYKIDRVDLDKLEYHAMVNHKIPVFITQFIQDGQIYLTINLENLEDMILYWQGAKRACMKRFKASDDLIKNNEEFVPDHKVIKSGNKEKYYKEREKEYASRRTYKRSKSRSKF